MPSAASNEPPIGANTSEASMAISTSTMLHTHLQNIAITGLRRLNGDISVDNYVAIDQSQIKAISEQAD